MDYRLQITDFRLRSPGDSSRKVILLIGALLAFISAGCVGTQSWLAKKEPEPPVVSQAHALWKNQIFIIPDPANGGTPTPFLAGRLYLMGPELGTPVLREGTVTIDLYDVTSGQPGQTPLERWNFSKEDLQKFAKKDPIGEGYTLVFPWTTYRPEISRVQLHARFTAEKAVAPIFTPPATVTLRNEGNVPIISRQVPASSVQQTGLKK